MLEAIPDTKKEKTSIIAPTRCDWGSGSITVMGVTNYFLVESDRREFMPGTINLVKSCKGRVTRAGQKLNLLLLF